MKSRTFACSIDRLDKLDYVINQFLDRKSIEFSYATQCAIPAVVHGVSVTPASIITTVFYEEVI